MLEYFNEELRAQENCCIKQTSSDKLAEEYSRAPKPTARFDIHNQASVCVYCKQKHNSGKCRTVTNIGSRKQILREEGRCFICLEEGHGFRKCHSSYKCNKCEKLANRKRKVR